MIEMEEAVLTRTKGFFRKNDLLFRIILLAFIISITVYAFLFGNALLKILTILSIAILIFSFLSHYIFNFLYGEGYKIAYFLNEILYLFLGIPILIIVIGYFPLSIYITFFSRTNNEWMVPILIGIMIVLQVSSFFYVIKSRAKEKNRTIFQFLKYFFDFKTRAEEREKQKKHAEEIENFYAGMTKVKKRVETKMEESVVGFKEYEWKKGSKTKEEEKET